MARQVTIGLLDETPDGLNRHDVESILSCFAEDCECRSR